MKKVVVTTVHRGVFFGKLVDYDIEKAVVTLKDAQMCTWWSKTTRGVLGCAVDGPQPGSRVTKVAPSVILVGVTSVMDCTDVAATVWESTPWTE